MLTVMVSGADARGLLDVCRDCEMPMGPQEQIATSAVRHTL